MSKVLIVYARASQISINATLLDTAVTTLESQGHEVTVSDLYEMKFDPVVEFNEEADVAQDIQEEQRKISEADLLLFQFPLSLFSMPAIMKGWLDRVFQDKFIGDINQGQIYSQGFLKGKRAVISVTTERWEHEFVDGPHGAMEKHMHSIEKTLSYAGLDVLDSNVCYAPTDMNDDEKQEVLNLWSKRVINIVEETSVQTDN